MREEIQVSESRGERRQKYNVKRRGERRQKQSRTTISNVKRRSLERGDRNTSLRVKRKEESWKQEMNKNWASHISHIDPHCPKILNFKSQEERGNRS